jgi:C4-type Zn-finger protein
MFSCPKCNADFYNIETFVTAMYGPGNIITYRCRNCGYSWKEQYGKEIWNNAKEEIDKNRSSK